MVLLLRDLDGTCRYADHLVVRREGRVLATGSPAEVMMADVIAEAYGLEALVQRPPVSGTPMAVPIAPLALAEEAIP